MIYVLQTLTGQELRVRDALIGKGYAAIVPRRVVSERKGGKWREVERTLFSGYVFLKLPDKLDDKTYHAATNVHGEIRFCGNGNQPIPIAPSEEEYIKLLSPGGNPLGTSEILQDGDTVRVISGPLKNFEGRILAINKRQRRAKVAIELFGCPQTVELSVTCVSRQG
ncbi:transcription termination/antitermination protein NusG [Clostridia bacterium]|nr:transcription termination/antitermination protein NusG [Clostridia bacterium]